MSALPGGNVASPGDLVAELRGLRERLRWALYGDADDEAGIVDTTDELVAVLEGVDRIAEDLDRRLAGKACLRCGDPDVAGDPIPVHALLPLCGGCARRSPCSH